MSQTIERRFSPDPKLELAALENFEMYWVKRPLNNIRTRMGWPEITPDDLKHMLVADRRGKE